MHDDFSAAGAEVATTNTYLALPDRLESVPLPDRLESVLPRGLPRISRPLARRWRILRFDGEGGAGQSSAGSLHHRLEAGRTADTLTLAAPSTFVASYVAANLSGLLMRAAAAEEPGIRRVKVIAG